MCSVIGSALVIMGLYFVLWGKSKEASPPSSSSHPAKEAVPVLQQQHGHDDQETTNVQMQTV